MAVRVLIADGSPRVRDAIRHYLECIGCDVVAEAQTGAQALPLLRTVRPELVTLGIGLPYGGQATSIDLLRLVKRELPRTWVLMLGCARAAGEMQLFLDEGALGYITEPFDSASFADLWRELSAVFPELRGRGVGAIMTSPRTAMGLAH